MTKFIIEIPDPDTPRVLDGIAKRYRYDMIKTILEDKEETKLQFMRRMMVEWIYEGVEAGEKNEVIRKAVNRMSKQIRKIEIKVT